MQYDDRAESIQYFQKKTKHMLELITRRPNSTKSITATSKYSVSEIANKMNRHPVDIFLNVALPNVKRLRVFPTKPSKNVTR